MTRKLFTLLFIGLCANTFAQQWEWVRQVNGAQNDYTSDLFVDDAGNVYATGRNKFGVTFEDDTNPVTPTFYGHTDAFLAKYSNIGELQWATLVGSSDPDWGWCVTVDHLSNVYLTGEFSGQAVFGTDTITSKGDRDVFVTKFDPSGNIIWTTTFGTAGTDKGKGIEVDAAGDIYVAGFIADTVTVNGDLLGTAGVSNGFIVKMSPNGNFIHQEDIGPDFGQGLQMKSDKAGHIYLCGDLLYDTYVADYLVTGPTTLGWRDGFLTKMDTALSVEWVELVASSFLNLGEALSISDNHVYLTGFYTGTCDFSGTQMTYNGTGIGAAAVLAGRDVFVSKYDLDGNLIWVKGFGGTGYDYGFDVAASPDDYVYIAGVFADTVDFDSFQLISEGSLDTYIAKLDQDGNVLWVKHKAGISDVAAYCVSIDQHQNVFVGGAYDDNSQVFDTITTSNVGYDGFIGKLTQHPNPQMMVSDTAFCEGDTVKLYPSAITSPITYTWDVSSQTGWVQNDTFCFVTVAGMTDISGTLIASNNIYTDSLNFNETIQILPGTNCGLGFEDYSVPFHWTFDGVNQLLLIHSETVLNGQIFSISGGLVGNLQLPEGSSITGLSNYSAGVYLIRLSSIDGHSENIKLFLK